MNPIDYMRETRTELKHVSWPTRRQAIQFTVLVVVLSIVVAALLGAFDFVYNFILQELILDAPVASDIPVDDSAMETGTHGEVGGSPLEVDVEPIVE